MKNEFLFPHDVYEKYLTLIEGVHFTPREVDVMACLVSVRGTSKIASLLNIAPSTVVTHIQNAMLKLGCSSREGILDFIETSHKLLLIKQYYARLVVHMAFEKSLRSVPKLKEAHCVDLVVYVEDIIPQAIRLGCFKSHLGLAGLKVDVRSLSSRSYEGRAFSQTPTIVLEKEESVLLQAPNPEVVSFALSRPSIETSYYFFVFDIFKRALPQLDLSKAVAEFERKCKGMEGVASASYPQITLSRENRKGEGKFSLCNEGLPFKQKVAFSTMHFGSLCF